MDGGRSLRRTGRVGQVVMGLGGRRRGDGREKEVKVVLADARCGGRGGGQEGGRAKIWEGWRGFLALHTRRRGGRWNARGDWLKLFDLWGRAEKFDLASRDSGTYECFGADRERGQEEKRGS